MVYAVIDTNILVSALITHNSNASTVKVVESIFMHKLSPLYNDEIMDEYTEVLYREKFKLSESEITPLLNAIKQYGINSSQTLFAGVMPDEDDRVFYEVTLSKEDSFLVTGNLKHFPKTPQVVTASQMLEILESDNYC